MPELQASRRLVKSPPELWAEVSDASALARHLGEVGEIRITRLEPETTVAWEGERASGTVELAPAGWGTSVTLTAEPVAPGFDPSAAEPAPGAAEAGEPAPIAAETGEPGRTRRGWLSRLLRRPAPPAAASETAREPETAPQPAAPQAAAPQPELTGAALESALDSLGSAHHRPFSRG